MVSALADQRRTVLVTGAAGLIGVPAVREFVRAGWRVIATDIANTERLEPSASILVRECDVLDLTAADLEGVSAVVHLGALTLSSEPRRDVAGADRADSRPMVSVNVLGTEHLFRIAVAASVPAVVYASTAAVYGPPPPSYDGVTAYPSDGPFRPSSLYAHSKLMCEGLAEHYAASSKSRFVGMRPTFSYGLERLTGISGAFAQFIVDAVAGRPARLGAPFGLSGQLQLIYVDDMARSFVAAVELALEGWGPQRAVVLNSPTTEMLRMDQIVRVVVEETGNRDVALEQPHFDRQLVMPVMDTRFAADLLGFEQRYPFRSAVREIASRVSQ